MNNVGIETISDTAFWVSSYRAKESHRPDAIFNDPYAELLSGQKGSKIAENISDSQYAEWTVIVRTRVIDDMIQALIGDGIEMVINLGAGLDTRPFRLEIPPSLNWIEIDHPHLIDYKKSKMKDAPSKCQLEQIGMDLSHYDNRLKLFSELNSRNKRTLVLTEGVIPYLTEEETRSLATDLRGFSHFQFWILEYHSKSLYRHLNNKKKNREMAQSPFKFFPHDWFAFFLQNGWTKKDIRYLGEVGDRLNRPFPLPWWAKFLNKLAPAQVSGEIKQMSGFTLLEKIRR